MNSKANNNVTNVDTVSQTVARMIEAETAENLFDLKVGETRIYQHLRFILYYEIMRQLDIYEPQYISGSWDRLRNSMHHVKHCLLQNDLWGVSRHEVVVLESLRRTFSDGHYGDIYTERVLREFSKDFCVIRWPFLTQGYKNERGGYRNIIYYDYFALKRKVKRSLKFGRNIIRISNFIANKIDTALKKHVNGNINVIDIVKTEILNAYHGITIANRFIEKVKPSLIIVVNAYGHTHFVHAARQLGIRVVELQHGVISPYHMGYHYPNVKPGSLEAFPDQVLTFGDYWCSAAAFPIPKEDIIATGFPHLEAQTSRYSSLKRNKRQILFVSQKVVGKELAEMAVEIAQRLPNYVIVFKLHPKQYRFWSDELKCLAVNKPANLLVVGGDGPPLYKLFAMSACQVGVFSTAIYEGLWWGLKTIILGLPGWEYMQRLIESGAALLGSNSDETIQYIIENRETSVNIEEIFKPNAVNNIIVALNENL
jgi:hypothetical protein